MSIAEKRGKSLINKKEIGFDEGLLKDPSNNGATRRHVTAQLDRDRSPRKVGGHQTNHGVANGNLSDLPQGTLMAYRIGSIKDIKILPLICPYSQESPQSSSGPKELEA